MNGHELIGQPRQEPAGAAADVKTGIDPLRYCVMTTVALLAWAFGPWAVMAMAGIGFVAYWQATRGGLTKSRCVLRYPALVMTYLGLAFVGAGVALFR
ncbi:MAG TPA: hypothetical protein VF483_00040, partial [Gemmatimonadaceae bacterium]